MSMKRLKIHLILPYLLLIPLLFLNLTGEVRGEDSYPDLNMYQFSVSTSFNLTKLTANQTISATVTTTNISSTPFETPINVLSIIGLYDRNNTMLDVSYSSKAISYKGKETLSSSLKLPSDVTGCLVKVFLWDGTNLSNTYMIPLADTVTLSDENQVTPSPTPSSSSAQYKVFILAGQSNMAGVGMNHELSSEYLKVQDNVKIYAEGTVDTSINGIWSSLRPGFGSGAGAFGPELTFGEDIASRLPNSKILLIKCGWSGTSLSNDWRSPSAGGTTGALWTHLITTVNEALSKLDSNIDYELSGMCWMQGESDACSIYPANDYESNLTYFINDVRSELEAPSLPFIIAMIDDSPSWIENAVVREAQTNIANTVPNVGIFDTKDLETDGMHYKTQGMLDMGSLFAETMIEELSQK